MDKLADVLTLSRQFQSDAEKQEFIEAQHQTITNLCIKIRQHEAEISHLKEMLRATVPLLEQPKVESIVVTPEEALIECQIDILQLKGISRELTLEDVKKLDLLLKNKHIIKHKPNLIKGESRRLPFDPIELLKAIE